MKHDNGAHKSGPPPEELPENDVGWQEAWLFLALIIIGPLVYSDPQLGAIEAWVVDVCYAVR